MLLGEGNAWDEREREKVVVMWRLETSTVVGGEVVSMDVGARMGSRIFHVVIFTGYIYAYHTMILMMLWVSYICSYADRQTDISRTVRATTQRTSRDEKGRNYFERR